jgi:hypothetical protein
MIVPIDPYKALYFPKLFTKAENANVEQMLKKVASTEPGDTIRHRFWMAGAYLYMKAIE